MVRTLGIDEAGRGCVLGDLVIAGFLVEGEADVRLREAGAADSKAISKAKRELARERLDALGTADVRRVSCKRIDAGNLNQLEEAVIIALVKRWRPDRVIVDALGHPRTLPKVVARLSDAVGFEVEWEMTPKADAKFPVVGAASIFAKTTRDDLLAGHAVKHGDFGSGYPSDPKTRRWLATWADSGRPWPSFVRTRWATIDLVRQESLF